MPAAEIGPDLAQMTLEKAAGLKAYWKASMQAIVRRARDLKRILPSRYDRLCAQTALRGYRTHEPVPIAAEEPTLLRQLVELHMDSHGHSIDDLCHMALVRDPKEFCSLYVPDRARQIRFAG